MVLYDALRTAVACVEGGSWHTEPWRLNLLVLLGQAAADSFVVVAATDIEMRPVIQVVHCVVPVVLSTALASLHGRCVPGGYVLGNYRGHAALLQARSFAAVNELHIVRPAHPRYADEHLVALYRHEHLGLIELVRTQIAVRGSGTLEPLFVQLARLPHLQAHLQR
jgi:hypothetical protein